MTREQIIEMAREAGFESSEYGLNCTPGMYAYNMEIVERFAALVRKDYSFTHAQMWLKRFDDAIKAEREACAKVAEKFEPDEKLDYVTYASTAIRARSKQ